MYWGFIIPSGNFSPAEFWWISFSGNLASIVLGLLPIPFIPLIRRRVVGELLYSFACVESIYSLIVYPILSFTAQRGDWLRIYDFSIQPYAAITLVLHIGLLGALWQIYGSQAALRWRLARTPNVFQTWQTLQRNVEDNPKSLQTHLELAYFLLQQNEVREANKVAKKMETIAPNSEQIQVFQVAKLYTKKSYGKAVQLGKTLLTANLALEEQLRLYQILCMSLYQMNRLSEALSYASQGLENASNDWRLRYHRSVVYQMLKQAPDALADLEVAIEYAPDDDVRQQLQAFELKIKDSIKQRAESNV